MATPLFLVVIFFGKFLFFVVTLLLFITVMLITSYFIQRSTRKTCTSNSTNLRSGELCQLIYLYSHQFHPRNYRRINKVVVILIPYSDCSRERLQIPIGICAINNHHSGDDFDEEYW